MGWLHKALAAFIGADSGPFRHDEVPNHSLLKEIAQTQSYYGLWTEKLWTLKTIRS